MASILEEGPIRKILRERRILKHSPEVVPLLGPDVSITVFDDNIHFIFSAGALEADRTLPRDKAIKILDEYIRTLEKDVAVLKVARARIG